MSGGCLRYEGICQIQNRYDFLKGENLSFPSASLKDLTVFYGGLSVHGGCLRYEGICQIQNRYDFLKGENLSFHVDINFSGTEFYGGLSVHGGYLSEGICQIQNRYFLKGIMLLCGLNVSASFKHLKLMPEPRNGFIYVSFFPSRCIVLHCFH